MLSGSPRLAALVLALSSCTALATHEPDGGLTLHYGEVDFVDNDAWERIDDQVMGAVALDWPIRQGPWNYEVGFAYFAGRSSKGNNGSVKSNSTEFSAGVRRRLGPYWESINPYLSVGLAALYTETRVRPAVGEVEQGEDWNGGVYFATGAWGMWGEYARVGLEFRYLNEETLDPGELNIDHTRLTFTLGYGF